MGIHGNTLSLENMSEVSFDILPNQNSCGQTERRQRTLEKKSLTKKVKISPSSLLHTHSICAGNVLWLVPPVMFSARQPPSTFDLRRERRTSRSLTLPVVGEIHALAVGGGPVVGTYLQDAGQRADPLLHVLLALRGQHEVGDLVHLQLEGVLPQTVVLQGGGRRGSEGRFSPVDFWTCLMSFGGKKTQLAHKADLDLVTISQT